MKEALLTLAFLVGGVLLLALFVWSWRGGSSRARWWHHDTRGSDSMAMGVFPGAGVVLIGVAGVRALPESISGIPIFIIVVGAIGGMIGAVIPRLWGPRWYKDYLARQKRKARKRR